MILVDSGPLVAVLHADDRNHARCTRALRSLQEPLGTVWPVLNEALALLSFSRAAQEALWEMVETEVLSLLALDRADAPRMKELMRRHRSMGLADAALVRVAERERIRRIFSLDRRDFSAYRPDKIGKFSIIP